MLRDCCLVLPPLPVLVELLPPAPGGVNVAAQRILSKRGSAVADPHVEYFVY